MLISGAQQRIQRYILRHMSILFQSHLTKLYIFLYIYIYIVLKYSWLVMFQVHSKVIQTHILLLKLFSFIGYYRILTIIPCAIELKLVTWYISTFLIGNIALFSYYVKQVKSTGHFFFFRQKFIGFLKYILCILFTYMYTKAFLLCLIKAWERA